MKESSRPRLSIEITEEQHLKLMRLLPWGIKGQLFREIIDDVIAMLETHGEQFIAAIITRRIKLQDYSISIKEKKDE